MTDREDRLQDELAAMTEERDIAGTLLARIVVALEPGRGHWDQVDIDALPEQVEALVAEQARLRATVTAACSELDSIAEQSGYGAIGDVVSQLIYKLDLSYPAPEG